MATKMLEASVRQQGAIAVIEMRGEIDSFGEEALNAAYAEAEERKQEGDGGPARVELRAAHSIESEPPTAALHDAEAQQDRNCAHVRNEQIKEACAANFRDAMLRRHQEIGR